MLNPRWEPTFLAGKALNKLDSNTNFLDSLKESVTNHRYILQDLRDHKNTSDLATRSGQVGLDLLA